MVQPSKSIDAAPIPVCKPRLPATAALLPYLAEIEKNRWYSNFGPLAMLLTQRFADHLRLNPNEVLLTSSGTAALSAALMATARPDRKRCLVASWTFVASAGACLAAGLVPHFCDIDPHSWSLDPEALSRRTDLADIAAVLVTCPFGAPIDTMAWDAFSETTGIPVVIDAAAAFGALDAGACAVSRAVLVVSLHATKTFGVGEGGMLLSRDRAAVRRALAAINFGFDGSRIAQCPGFNGKLSEFTAAIGLAALDHWEDDRAAWQTGHKLYRDRRDAFEARGVLQLTTWITSTINWVGTDASAANEAERFLAAERIDTRRWWGDGCHANPAYETFSRDALPVTENIASRCLGLPMYPSLTPADADRIADAFRRIRG